MLAKSNGAARVQEFHKLRDHLLYEVSRRARPRCVSELEKGLPSVACKQQGQTIESCHRGLGPYRSRFVPQLQDQVQKCRQSGPPSRRDIKAKLAFQPVEGLARVHQFFVRLNSMQDRAEMLHPFDKTIDV